MWAEFGVCADVLLKCICNLAKYVLYVVGSVLLMRVVDHEVLLKCVVDKKMLFKCVVHHEVLLKCVVDHEVLFKCVRNLPKFVGLI